MGKDWDKVDNFLLLALLVLLPIVTFGLIYLFSPKNKPLPDTVGYSLFRAFDFYPSGTYVRRGGRMAYYK